jgi:hypothetical protein
MSKGKLRRAGSDRAGVNLQYPSEMKTDYARPMTGREDDRDHLVDCGDGTPDELGVASDALMRQFAEIARLPDRDPFLWVAIRHTLIYAWEANKSRKALISNKPLSRVVEALKSAQQALVDLDQEQRNALKRPIHIVENGINELLDSVFGRGQPGLDPIEPSQPRANQRGRRPGAVKNPAFQNFVRGLLHAAEVFDGKLTLEKNIEKGTLVEAINLFAPHLPVGFVPEHLSFSTLQRIKSKWSREMSERRARNRTKK